MPLYKWQIGTGSSAVCTWPSSVNNYRRERKRSLHRQSLPLSSIDRQRRRFGSFFFPRFDGGFHFSAPDLIADRYWRRSVYNYTGVRREGEPPLAIILSQLHRHRLRESDPSFFLPSAVISFLRSGLDCRNIILHIKVHINSSHCQNSEPTRGDPAPELPIVVLEILPLKRHIVRVWVGEREREREEKKMGFLTLLEVASMPIVQVLLISTLGALMTTEYLELLSTDTRKSLNKIVFMVFTPSLTFASLAETVTLQDVIAWWFMVVNIGLTFLIGGILGWIAVKLLKPKPHLEGLIIATCSSGNLGNLLLIIVPAVCKEDGGPFGNDHKACRSVGLSYASLSMALGGFYIWTYTYQLIRSSALKYKALEANEEIIAKLPNKDLDANGKTCLLEGESQEPVTVIVQSSKSTLVDAENQLISSQAHASKMEIEKKPFLGNLVEVFHQILEELMAPPTLAAIIGFVFGAIPWLKYLIIGDTAPLRVVQDSLKLLGDGTIPCITLILGGNLIQGLRNSTLRPATTVAVVCVKYAFLPIIGIGVVRAAASLGFLPTDPLYHYVLMVQFVLPPAMSISTMTQLFDVAQEECSVLFLWTYLVACLSLTAWSTVFMWILS